MEAAVIDKIVALKDAGQLHEVGGKTFSPVKLHPVYHEPRPDALKVSTLGALAQYLKHNVDEIDPDVLLLHVHSPRHVQLISKFYGEEARRDVLITATVPEEMQDFPFGKFLGPEEFAIKLRTLFEPTKDRERIIAYTAKLTQVTSVDLEDDGITQRATVKRGVSGAVSSEETAPVIVALSPYRTFRELPQVNSDFLLRIKSGDSGTSLALFEADGGAWRIDAVDAVAQWLMDNAKGVAVIA